MNKNTPVCSERLLRAPRVAAPGPSVVEQALVTRADVVRAPRRRSTAKAEWEAFVHSTMQMMRKQRMCVIRIERHGIKTTFDVTKEEPARARAQR